MKKGNQVKETKHEIMQRYNSESNPVLLPSATFLFQPNGFPFNAQVALNLNQAKVIVKIIEHLQEPIVQTIENEHFRKQPLQLSLFDNDSNIIHLDFELSEFNTNPANYNKLKQDIIELKNYTVKQDIIYYNKSLGEEIEAIEYKNFLYSVKLPKKYERKVTLSLDKDVAKFLVNVGTNGYTKYLLEVALQAESKYTLLIYQLISSWREKGGFKWTIERFKKYLGIFDKYSQWSDLNRYVIKPAYEELFENSDLWFEYDVQYKGKTPYLISFKIISGYFKVNENFNNQMGIDNFVYKIDFSKLSKRQLECFNSLKNEILINDENIICEITSERCEDFYRWYNVNKSKLFNLDNPAGNLLFYLNMVSAKGWKAKKYHIINEGEKKSEQDDYSELWNSIILKLKERILEQEIEVWFNPMGINRIVDNSIYVSAPSKFLIDEVKKRFGDIFFSSLKKCLNNENLNLFFEIKEG